MERADAAGGSACRWLCLEWQDLSEPVEGGLRDHRHALERAEILRPAGQAIERVLTMKAGSTKVVRCAIYTRVSTDQGLEQDFNSLDAQYDASRAYIRRPRRHQTTAGTHDDPDYRPVQLFNDQTPSIAWARKLPPMLHLETRGRAMRRSAPFPRIRSRARPTGVTLEQLIAAAIKLNHAEFREVAHPSMD